MRLLIPEPSRPYLARPVDQVLAGYASTLDITKLICEARRQAFVHGSTVLRDRTGQLMRRHFPSISLQFNDDMLASSGLV